MTNFQSDDMGWQNSGIVELLFNSFKFWSSPVDFLTFAAFEQRRWLEVATAQ